MFTSHDHPAAWIKHSLLSGVGVVYGQALSIPWLTILSAIGPALPPLISYLARRGALAREIEVLRGRLDQASDFLDRIAPPAVVASPSAVVPSPRETRADATTGLLGCPGRNLGVVSANECRAALGRSAIGDADAPKDPDGQADLPRADGEPRPPV